MNKYLKTRVGMKLEPQNEKQVYKDDGFIKDTLYIAHIDVVEDPICGILIRVKIEGHTDLFYTSLMTLYDDWWILDNKTSYTVMRRYADINTTIDSRSI